jgi:hypothetical protein
MLLLGAIKAEFPLEKFESLVHANSDRLLPAKPAQHACVCVCASAINTTALPALGLTVGRDHLEERSVKAG